jgi:hypothetical protein
MRRYHSLSQASKLLHTSPFSLKETILCLDIGVNQNNRLSIDDRDIQYLDSVHRLRKESGLNVSFLKKMNKSMIDKMIELL